MAFIDLLRTARTSKTSILHKFLTNYNPGTKRVYAFVEGDPDKHFYRIQIRRNVPDDVEVFIYNCEGKSKVYETYREIMLRYPDCRRVLFFVDKDVDDIVGLNWPSDPRIHTTDVYAIENYLCAAEALDGYIRDFLKMRGCEFDQEIVQSLYREQEGVLNRLFLPIMAWVVFVRRNGGKVVLNDVRAEDLFVMKDSVISRSKASRARACLLAASRDVKSLPGWREIRSVCRELKRHPPKNYIRGKYVAWWFLTFVRQVEEGLSKVAREAGGKVSSSNRLNEGNMIQVLTPLMPTPHTIGNFLRFHLCDSPSSSVDAAAHQSSAKSILDKIPVWFGFREMNRRRLG